MQKFAQLRKASVLATSEASDRILCPKGERELSGKRVAAYHRRRRRLRRYLVFVKRQLTEKRPGKRQKLRSINLPGSFMFPDVRARARRRRAVHIS